MSDHLLPPNASAQERGLSLAIERAGAVPVGVRSAWNPDTCPANMLPWLAWAFGVDEWDSAWSEEQKRDTIRRSIVVHRYKGTIGAVLDALGALGVSAQVQEWFNQLPPAAPYTFRIHMESDQYGITSEEQVKLLRVLERTKNLRSHLEGIDLVVKTRTGPVVAAASSVGSSIVVPYYSPPPAVDVLSVVAAPTVSEGAAVLAYVTLSNAAGSASIPFSVGGVSAADLGAITFSAGVTRSGFSLAVPSGVSGFVITVHVVEDAVYEAGETLYINVGAQTAAVAITDTSVPPTVLSITAAGGATSFNEGTSATFTVLLSNGYGWVGLPFGITGVAGADVGAPVFTAGVMLTGGLLTIPAGVSTFGVTVPLVSDFTEEGPETLTLVVGDQSASVTVNDTSVSTGYDVLSLPGLVAWFDASEPANYTLVGGKVATWFDLSPNGNHLTQPNDSVRYSLATGTAKDGGDRFVSANKGWMLFPDGDPLLGQHTYIAVGSSNANFPYGSIFLSTQSSNAYRLLLENGQLTSNKAGTVYSLALPAAWGNDTTDRVMYTRWDGGDPVHGITDGVQDFSQAMPNGSNSPGLMNGMTSYAASSQFNLTGTICEIIICNQPITLAQLAEVKAYLAQKWCNG